MLAGDSVALRIATTEDVAALAGIRRDPAVYERWRGDDIEAEIIEAMSSDEIELYAIEFDGAVIGAIQSYVEDDPDYRHAGIDIYLAPAVHGQGLGADAVRTLARHLFVHRGHHRLVIDPAADNAAAIAAYSKVGFRVVGTMRQYERGSDGTWHDAVLMELLRDDFEAQ